MVAAWIQSLRPIPMAVAVQDRIVCNFLNVTGGYMKNVLCVSNKGIKFFFGRGGGEKDSLSQNKDKVIG